MFCFRCGASMPDDAQVCPQCAAPVQNVSVPLSAQPATPPPASAWLNAPPPQQTSSGQPYPGQYPGQTPGQTPDYALPPRSDGKALASLILGVLSIFCFSIFTGIPAIILGHVSRGNVRRSMGRLTGEGMALAGLILGYCSVALSVLVIAAIVIPNLTRARVKANESAAQSTVRTLNTSQITYSTSYPEKGYAPDLASLGPGPNNCAGGANAERACLIDGVLGKDDCKAQTWCAKFSYKFSLAREGTCPGTPAGSGGENEQECNYVIVATPAEEGMGAHSYCSTSDAIVRQRFGSPIAQPITVEECSSWSPVS